MHLSARAVSFESRGVDERQSQRGTLGALATSPGTRFPRLTARRLRLIGTRRALTNDDSRSNLRTWRAIDLIGFFEKETRGAL